MAGRIPLRLLAVMSLVIAVLVLGAWFESHAVASPVKSLAAVFQGTGSIKGPPPTDTTRLLALYHEYEFDYQSAGGLFFLAAVLSLFGLSAYGPTPFRKVVKGSIFALSACLFLFYLNLVGLDNTYVASPGYPHLAWFFFPAVNAVAGGSLFVSQSQMQDILSGGSFGYMAAMTFMLAVVGLFMGLHSLGRKWVAALRDALALFAVPGLLILELTVWWTTPSQMSMYVITALAKTQWAPVLTNWNVLYAALVIGALVYGSLMYAPVKRMVHSKVGHKVVVGANRVAYLPRRLLN